MTLLIHLSETVVYEKFYINSKEYDDQHTRDI